MHPLVTIYYAALMVLKEAGTRRGGKDVCRKLMMASRGGLAKHVCHRLLPVSSHCQISQLTCLLLSESKV